MISEALEKSGSLSREILSQLGNETFFQINIRNKASLLYQVNIQG